MMRIKVICIILTGLCLSAYAPAQEDTTARQDKALLRFLQTDSLKLSEEALYWVHLAVNASDRNTVIAGPLFMPLVFKGDILPDNLAFYQPFKPSAYAFTPWYPPDTALFRDYKRERALDELALRYVEEHNPTAFRYSQSDFPDEVLQTVAMRTPRYKKEPLKVKSEVKVEDVDAPAKFIPDRLYWQSAFESVLQFSQNYLTPNWYKGGASNLNIFTRNYLKYDYNKNKVQFTNELELKASIYNAPNDTLHNYKIGDDLFRIHSNFGYRAFNKWYYTVDGEIKTQLFSNYQENTPLKQAAFFSPFSVNLGIGMKYELTKAYKTRNKKLQLSLNLAPVSYTYLYSIDEKIDLGRHGFRKKEDSDEYDNALTRIGSSIRADMTMAFNRNVSWQSRFYYFTTYELTQFEFENTLTLAISRYFSTRIYAHLRYDDSVTKNPDFDSFFQLNELISFGFNYKW